MAYRGVDDSKANASKLSTAHTQRTGGPTVDRVRKEQLKGGLFGNAPKGPLRHEDEEEEEALGKLNGIGSKKATAPSQTTKASGNPTESISDADLAESLKLLEQLGSATQATASTSGTATGSQTKPSHTNTEPQSQRRVIGTHPPLDEGQADWSKLEPMQPTNSKVPPVSSRPQPVKVELANKKEEDDEEEQEALPGVSRQKPPAAATTTSSIGNAPARNASTALGSSTASSSKVETTATPQTATVRGSSKPIAQPLLHVPRAAREDDEAEEAEEGEEDAEIQFVPKSQRGRTDGDKMNELRQSIVASKQMALGFATNERKVVSLDQVSGASAVDDTDRPNDPVEWEAFLARRKEREVRLRGILGSS